jgi:hypothetical protein
MYSDMSMRTMACSSSNRKAASARVSSVLPTPVGPRNMNEPIGRLGSCKPARARRTAVDTARTASSWPTTRRRSASSMARSFSRSPCSIRSTGMPVQRDTTWATWFSVTASSTIGAAVCSCASTPAAGAPARHDPVGKFAGARQITAALRLLELGAGLVELFLDLLGLAQPVLLALPFLGQLGGGLLELGELALELLEALARGRIGLLLQGFALDLQLNDAPIELIELLGLGVDLHAQPRGRLVHQIDGLVGQKAVGDVAVRQGRGRNQGGIGDPHAMVHLVFFLEAAEDRDGVLHRRLGHEHRLEAAGEGGILLDVLAVFIERCGADAVQFAAGQGRLQEVGGIHGAFRLAGADKGVHLVDEQHDAAGRGLDLGQHRLQPLLELAAVLRPGDQRAHVERHQPLVAQAFGHVAVDDAQGQSFGDGRLADARLADQNRVVLGAPRQDLDAAADFLVATDDRVELALARRLGEVAGIAVEGIIALFGGRRVGGAALAQGSDRLLQGLRRHAGAFQRLLRLARLGGERLQQALGRHEGIAGLGCQLARGLEHARHLGRQVNLSGPGSFHLGMLAQRRLGLGKRHLGVAAGRTDETGRQTVGIVKQHLQEMLGGKPLMAFPQGDVLRRLHKAPRAFGIFFKVHRITPQPAVARSLAIERRRSWRRHRTAGRNDL